MIETIQHNGNTYPAIQAEGFAAQFAFQFARKFCIGSGVDIGPFRPEWSFPGSFVVEPQLMLHDAMKFPLLNDEDGWDYIFSSHCLEHLRDYVAALDYWSTRLRHSGVLFLYLPNMDYQTYWRPSSNRQHLHYISPKIMQSYFDDRKEMWNLLIVTDGYDVNGSFYCIANKI